MRPSQFAGDATSVTTSFTTVLQRVLMGDKVLSFEVASAAGSATTTGFKIQAQDNVAGEFYDYLVDTDFDSTTNSNMLFASATGPHELAASGFAHVHFAVNAIYAIRLQAKVASGTATITIRGTERSE